MTVEIVWIGTAQDDQLCHCLSDHRPPNWVEEAHHCLPQGLGGDAQWKNIQGILIPNKVRLCATTHNSVHESMKLLLQNMPLPAHKVTTYGVMVAREGVTRIRTELARGTITSDQIKSYITHSVVRP